MRPRLIRSSGYGNWTGESWNVRLHGYVYKKPNIPDEKLDELTNIFLIDTSVPELLPDQATQAKDLTADIFVIQQDGVNLKFNLSPASTTGESSEPATNQDAEGDTPAENSQQLEFPYPTTTQGDFDAFVQTDPKGFAAGDSAPDIQGLNVQTDGISNPLGVATSYLVPPTGITILSDVDDILRITKIYRPTEALLNTFTRPFTPWLNMPTIFANWSLTLPATTHFHYLTTTPEQATRAYMQFIYATYPAGSFDVRPLNFSDVAATMNIRDFLLRKIFATFPERKFVLVADTSNGDVMQAYPAMALEFPEQVLCILLRDTQATDEGDHIPYNTKGFRDLDPGKYMFFNVPVSSSFSSSWEAGNHGFILFGQVSSSDSLTKSILGRPLQPRYRKRPMCECHREARGQVWVAGSSVWNRSFTGGWSPEIEDGDGDGDGDGFLISLWSWCFLD
jgi:hypothetical protein